MEMCVEKEAMAGGGTERAWCRLRTFRRRQERTSACQNGQTIVGGAAPERTGKGENGVPLKVFIKRARRNPGARPYERCVINGV